MAWSTLFYKPRGHLPKAEQTRRHCGVCLLEQQFSWSPHSNKKHSQTHICISILRLIVIKMKTENGKASISLVQYLPPYNGAPISGKQNMWTDSQLHYCSSKQAPLTVCMLQPQLKTCRSCWCAHRLREAAWAKESLWLWICQFRCYHFPTYWWNSSLKVLSKKRKKIKEKYFVFGCFSGITALLICIQVLFVFTCSKNKRQNIHRQLAKASERNIVWDLR